MWTFDAQPTLIRHAFSLAAAHRCPSYLLLPDKTRDPAWALRPLLTHFCPFSFSCRGLHTSPLFIPVLQLNRSQEEKPQGEWQKCKAEQLSYINLPVLPQLKKMEPGQVGEKEGAPGRELQRFLFSFLWLSPVPTFSILFFIFSCHFGLSSQIKSCFPNWPVKSFCHVEIISRATLGNLRQPGSLTAGMRLQ